MTLSEILGGFGLTILAGLTGHNYVQNSKLREEIPKLYRSKDDCTAICLSFQKTVDDMRKDMNHGFERVYDKLDNKEDKD